MEMKPGGEASGIKPLVGDKALGGWPGYQEQ
jgi:hypothetical protein